MAIHYLEYITEITSQFNRNGRYSEVAYDREYVHAARTVQRIRQCRERVDDVWRYTGAERVV